MTEKPGDVVQGTLDMLILKTLALEPMHGYGVAQRIEQISKGVFRVKYYLLSERGRKRLSTETREWGRQVAAIARILEAS